MGYLEGILKGKRTEAAVKEGLDELCGYIPTYLQVDVSNVCFFFKSQANASLTNPLTRFFSARTW